MQVQCVGEIAELSHKAKPPRSEDEAMAAVPRVSMDYFFMSKEDEKASTNPCLVMKNEDSGEKYARAVGQTGVGDDGRMDWLIKDISN